MNDFRGSLLRWIEAEKAALEEHPSVDVLLSYRGSRLEPAAAEALRDHLTLCNPCRAAYLASAEVLEPPATFELFDVTEHQVVAWDFLKRHLFEPQPKLMHRAISLRSASLPWSLLAAALLALVGLGTWNTTLQSRIRVLQQPVVNSTIVELVPDSEQLRGYSRQQISVGPNSARQQLMLILYPPVDVALTEKLRLDLFAEDNESLWSSTTHLGEQAAIFVTVPQHLLKPGNYYIQLSRFDYNPIETYQFQINIE